MVVYLHLNGQVEKADTARLRHVRKVSGDYCCPDSLRLIFAACKECLGLQTGWMLTFLTVMGLHHFVTC